MQSVFDMKAESLVCTIPRHRRVAVCVWGVREERVGRRPEHAPLFWCDRWLWWRTSLKEGAICGQGLRFRGHQRAEVFSTPSVEGVDLCMKK